MRRIKTIKVNDYEITIKELRVKDYIELMKALEAGSVIEDPKLLGIDISKEQLYDLAPSELKIIWEAFKEVNEVFFEIAQTVKLREALINWIGHRLQSVFAFSSDMAIITETS